MATSFAFIITHMEFQGALPIEIIPNHFFQRADNEQIVKIKNYLQRFGKSEWHDGFFERAYKRSSEEGSPGIDFTRLSSDQWRYWIVAFDGTNEAMQELEIAASLLKNDLQFGFSVLQMPVGGGRFAEAILWTQEFMSDYFSVTTLTRPVVSLNGDDLACLRNHYLSLKSVKTSHQNIYKTAQRFHLLKCLPQSSVFKVIGYFSIIEALITHAPELTEPMDSLTHQMKTKMHLLAKRFHRGLDYASFFTVSDSDKIWGKLYGYRSKVAHGDEADFSKEFKILNSHEHALQFLNEAAKLLILYATKEPEFILDLKKC